MRWIPLPWPAPLTTFRQIPRSRRAEILQRAQRASGRRRLADLATETDQSHVQRGSESVGNQIVQQSVGTLGARLGRDQPQAASDAVHVRIDGDRVAAEGE